MDKQEAILAMRDADDICSMGQIAKAVGCSSQYVRSVLLKNGRKTAGRTGYGPNLVRCERKEKTDFVYRWGRPIAPHVSGKIGELFVAADLMSRGYNVFAAIAHTCPCDFIAISPSGILSRVEAKCGKQGARSGNIWSPKPDPSKFDILGIVTMDNQVVYRNNMGEFIEP